MHIANSKEKGVILMKDWFIIIKSFLFALQVADTVNNSSFPVVWKNPNICY